MLELPERPMANISIAINQHVSLPFLKFHYSFQKIFFAAVSLSNLPTVRSPHLGRSCCHSQTANGLLLCISWHNRTCPRRYCFQKHPRTHWEDPSRPCRR